MTAYIIAEIEVTNPGDYEAYKAMVEPSFKGFSARFVVRGGKTVALEGEPPKRIVMLGFDSLEEAKRWYESPAYGKAKLKRQSCSTARLYIVEA